MTGTDLRDHAGPGTGPIPLSDSPLSTGPLPIGPPMAGPVPMVPRAAARDAPARAPRRTRPHLPAPRVTGRRGGFVGVLLALEVLALPAASLLAPPPDRAVAAGVALGSALVLATLPLGGLTATGWALTGTRWLRRRRALRRAARRPDHPLTAPVLSGVSGSPSSLAVPVGPIVSGSLVGPRRSEIGVLWSPGGWTGSLYVADGGADALTRLLALPASASGAVRLRSVLQQRASTAAGGGVLPLSAWLVLQVDPVPAVRARQAVGAVPALLRSEMRGLFDHTRPGAVGLVALDHADLVDALAASAEQPQNGTPPAAAAESWLTWRACGRTHQAFAVRPGALLLSTVVDLLLDGVALRPGTTVTVGVRHEPDARWPVTARVSHLEAEAVTDVVRRMRLALEDQGVRTRSLGGRQGTALLDTTLLATAG